MNRMLTRRADEVANTGPVEVLPRDASYTRFERVAKFAAELSGLMTLALVVAALVVSQ